MHVHLIDAFALLGRHEEAEVHFYMAVHQPECPRRGLAESLLDRQEYDRAVCVCAKPPGSIRAARPRTSCQGLR